MPRIRAFHLAFLFGWAAAFAGQRVTLFDGHSLAGWHTQGDCQWSVVGGAVRGVDPQGHWCHLVTDSVFGDFSLRMEYRIVQGNSGVFVRAGGENAGCCGLEGTQVDFGPSQDGSVMWVRDGTWGWYELITRAVTERWVDYAAWNVLDVDVQGASIRTAVNGHQVYASASLEKMAARGRIGLQLHSGGVNDTVLFRNLDLQLPDPVSLAGRVPRDRARGDRGIRLERSRGLMRLAPPGPGPGAFDARGRLAEFP
jgi:hypothetical protein